MSREMPWNTKLNKRTIKAHLIDAIGGGVCKIHGEYIGLGKHGLKSCPFCDIEAFYAQEKQTKRT